MPEPSLLAVFGNPIFHSRSPIIFSRLAKTQKINSVYLRVAVSSAKEILTFAQQTGLSGFNITAPFKYDIIPLLEKTDKHAKMIGAVNAVKIENGTFHGYNTDYIGVIDALKNNGAALDESNVFILGAGGAARAAAYGMIMSRAKNVFLANRTQKKAQAAAARLGCDPVPWEDRFNVIKKCNILISCIPQHPMDPYWDYLPKNIRILTADYKYRPDNLDPSNVQHINGREWLLYQALPGFKLFFRQKAPLSVIPQIKNDLAQDHISGKTNIALIGFMGSGKTTIGRKLAEKMGYFFVDTDEEIARAAGKTIPKIFRENGETSFRSQEKSLVERLVPPAKHTVFALGGGAVIEKKSRSLIQKNCLVIWLWAPLKTMLDRVETDTRPLLGPEKTLKNAYWLLTARRPVYAAASDLVIITESCKTGYTVERILNEIGLLLKH